MKTIKFWDLADRNTKLNFDGDKADLRLHSDESFNWGARTKADYKKACKEIDNVSYKGKGWQLFAWYDVSSYEYWMKQMQEQNYIQITIAFDSENVAKDEKDNILAALDMALADADSIAYKWNYNPMDLANIND